jgi:hypothetical protein
MIGRSPLFFLCFICLLSFHIENGVSEASESPSLPPKPISASPCPRFTNTTQVELEIFTTSKCESCSGMIQNLANVIKEHRLQPNVHVRFVYIATLSVDGNISSLNGPSEIIGDEYELCAMKYYSNLTLDFVVCMTMDIENIPDTAINCSNLFEMDFNLLSTCVEKEGYTLLRDSAKYAIAKGVSETDIPILYINGNKYYGTSDLTAINNALCMTGPHSSSLLAAWWLYSIIGGAAIAVCLILFLLLFMGYGVYLQCHNVTDKWLSMLKSNPGKALDFAEQVKGVSIRVGASSSGDNGSSSGSHAKAGTEEDYLLADEQEDPESQHNNNKFFNGSWVDRQRWRVVSKQIGGGASWGEGGSGSGSGGGMSAISISSFNDRRIMGGTPGVTPTRSLPGAWTLPSINQPFDDDDDNYINQNDNDEINPG